VSADLVPRLIAFDRDLAVQIAAHNNLFRALFGDEMFQEACRDAF